MRLKKEGNPVVVCDIRVTISLRLSCGVEGTDTLWSVLLKPTSLSSPAESTGSKKRMDVSSGDGGVRQLVGWPGSLNDRLMANWCRRLQCRRLSWIGF
jgi:hypothetical protein